jgi:hypothetical protein
MPVAINSERAKQLGEKGRELWADHQQIQQSTQSNRRVESIATITNVTINKTQQPTNINGSKEVEDSSGNELTCLFDNLSIN